MRITYRLLYQDYLDASRQRNAKKRRIQSGALLLISFAFIFYVQLHAAHPLSWPTFLSVILLTIALALAAQWLSELLFRLYFKQRFSKHSSTDKEMTVEISEPGLHLLDADAITAWSHFSTFSESNLGFVLYRAGKIEAIIPKRAFQDAGLEFRRVLNEHVRRV